MNIIFDKYREILIAPVRQCSTYSPKFGHKKEGGFSFQEFQSLYGQDAFYNWLGLDNQLMYAAHKAAGGITSVYRQIGIGCERLVREIFKDKFTLSDDDVKWSYTIPTANGKTRELSLDGRIIIDKIVDRSRKGLVTNWMNEIMAQLKIEKPVARAMMGIVFEVRQGYKSKDSKRQNADISNASTAYIKGYVPCLMVMSSQIDSDIVTRYSQNKWCILQGYPAGTTFNSTYLFFKNVVGFDMVDFMSKSQPFFRSEIQTVLEQLLRA